MDGRGAEMKCDNCRFCLWEDFGYSNYTVEGTNFNCLKGLHPDGVFDRFYGEDDRLKFAEKCGGFSKGEPVMVDCDHESLKDSSDPLSSAYTEDPEVAALMDAWEKAGRVSVA